MPVRPAARAAAAERTPHRRPSLDDAVAAAIRSRGRRELADLDLRRSIIRLDEEGMPQRAIAELVGLSQPEVSRRLKRREQTPLEPTPREIILRRAAGMLSSRAMMEELRALEMTSATPSEAARFDGGATSVGTAKQIALAYQEGLLSRSEYNRIRSAVSAAGEHRSA